MPKRPVHILVAFGVAVQLLFSGALWHALSARGIPLTRATGDDDAYQRLAEHLLAEGVFSQDRSPALVPDAVRTPAYTVWNAFWLGILGSWPAVLVVQAVLAGSLPVLVFRAFRPFHGAAAFWAAIAMAVLPNKLLWSSFLMTDVPMVLAVLAGLPSALRAVRGGRLRDAASAGAWFGFAALVRPVATFLWLPFGLAVVYAHRPRWRRGLALAGTLAAVQCACLLPWMARNAAVFGVFGLTPLGGYSFAYANASLFRHERTGEPLAAIRAEFERRIDGAAHPDESVGFRWADTYRAFAWEAIGPAPFRYLAWHAYKSVPMLVSDGLRPTAGFFGWIDPEDQPNLTDLLLRPGRMAALRAFGWASPLSFSLLLVGTGAWLGAYVLAAVGLWRRFRTGDVDPALAAVLLMGLGFLAVASGPVAQSRYRLPFEPILLFLAFLPRRPGVRLSPSSEVEKKPGL